MILHLNIERALSNKKGVTLVESLVALAIVAIAVIPFLAAFSTGSLNVKELDRRVTAQTLGRSQLEYTKNLAYVIAPASYAIFTPIPTGYSIDSDATSISGRDVNIQRVTVTVKYEGKVLLTLDDFKLNR